MVYAADSASHHHVTVVILLTLTSHVLGTCRFPQFLLKPDPWVGDYKDGRIVAYVKPTLISLIERNIKFSRECIQRAPDNKFLILHREDNQSIKFLCMQFIQRGENIVQIKTSDLYPRQSLDICDESGMAIDPFPLVNSGQTPESRIRCPFTGGYNMYAYHAHPNNSVVCSNLMLLMRMESECDQGEGITLDFRREECVPKDLPKNHKQRAHCVAHWTQDSYVFIILQHAEVRSQWFCLRTSDPLNNIKSAYLWMKVICDTSERPRPDVSQNYLRLEFTKRIFSSTCADELELCPEMTHYCTMPHSRHCAHTCSQCMSENQIGVCTFEEQYRGRWIESNTPSDTLIDVEAYSLNSQQTGKYDCVNLDSDVMPEKRVLLQLYTNGCFPRYACVEMEKVTSSVMKFRLGDRLTWPLASMKNQKEEICRNDNFRFREGHNARLMKERPARLLVNTGNIREVNCGLPARLQNGIAFREDGKNCGGCLNYEPHISLNHFSISPVNCTTESSEKKGYRNMPLEYSCLATFEFYNNTYSVVTKTTSFASGMGQYLVWIFTPDNQIKVLKAADTYVFELTPLIKSELVQAQFSILRNDYSQCRIVIPQLRTTTTTRTTPTSWRDYNIYNDRTTSYNPTRKSPSTISTPVYYNSNAQSMRGDSSVIRPVVYTSTLPCIVYTSTIVAFLSRSRETNSVQNIT